MADSLNPALEPSGQCSLPSSDLPVMASDNRNSPGRLRARILRVFGAHSLGNLVTLADRFLLLPVMLYVWGPKVTGVWLTIRSVPAVLSVGELGFASATGNAMTDHLARHENVQASRVYWSTARLINAISLICLVAITAVVLALPLEQWFQAQGVARWEFNAAILLMAVYTVSIFQTQLYYAGYRSIDLQARAALGTHLTRVAELALVVAALAWLPSVWAVAAAYLIARLAGALWLRMGLLKQATWLQSKPQTQWSEVKPLIKPALGYAALPLAQTFQLQASTLAVAAATGSELVATFTAMRTLARFPIQFCAAVGRTVWPELSQALAHHDYATTLRLHRRTILISLLMSLASVMALLLVGHWVFDIWTAHKLTFSWITFAILSVTAGLTAYSTNAMTLLNAMSVHGRTAAIWVGVALVTVVLTIVCAPLLSMEGISLILLIGDLAILAYVSLATHQHVRQLSVSSGGAVR